MGFQLNSSVLWFFKFNHWSLTVNKTKCAGDLEQFPKSSSGKSSWSLPVAGFIYLCLDESVGAVKPKLLWLVFQRKEESKNYMSIFYVMVKAGLNNNSFYHEDNENQAMSSRKSILFLHRERALKKKNGGIERKAVNRRKTPFCEVCQCWLNEVFAYNVLAYNQEWKNVCCILEQIANGQPEIFMEQSSGTVSNWHENWNCVIVAENASQRVNCYKE